MSREQLLELEDVKRSLLVQAYQTGASAYVAGWNRDGDVFCFDG